MGMKCNPRRFIRVKGGGLYTRALMEQILMRNYVFPRRSRERTVLLWKFVEYPIGSRSRPPPSHVAECFPGTHEGVTSAEVTSSGQKIQSVLIGRIPMQTAENRSWPWRRSDLYRIEGANSQSLSERVHRGTNERDRVIGGKCLRERDVSERSERRFGDTRHIMDVVRWNSREPVISGRAPRRGEKGPSTAENGTTKLGPEKKAPEVSRQRRRPLFMKFPTTSTSPNTIFADGIS